MEADPCVKHCEDEDQGNVQFVSSKGNAEAHRKLESHEHKNSVWIENSLAEKCRTSGCNEEISSSFAPKVLDNIIDAKPVESNLSTEKLYKITNYGINKVSSSDVSDISTKIDVAINSWKNSQLTCKNEVETVKVARQHPTIVQNAKLIKKILKKAKPPMPNWRNCGYAAQQPSNVNEIPRLPLHCPHCDGTISPSALMNHFITCHINNYEIFFVEIYLNQRCLLVCDPRKFLFDKVLALNLFAFGGSTRESVDKPIQRRIALPNATMPLHFAKYQEFTPILLLISRTSWAAVFGNKQLHDAINNKESVDETNDIWVIWLVSTQMIKPLHATISVYNHYLGESLSRIVRVRNLADSQKCSVFMRHDFNFLDLSYATVKSLSHDFSKPISMEVIFNTY